MREQKKHWGNGTGWSLCKLWGYPFANAKKNVTCKNCLRAMGEKK